jgi:hypothetical protein
VKGNKNVPKKPRILLNLSLDQRELTVKNKKFKITLLIGNIGLSLIVLTNFFDDHLLYLLTMSILFV